jgi:hypothetical protein
MTYAEKLRVIRVTFKLTGQLPIGGVVRTKKDYPGTGFWGRLTNVRDGIAFVSCSHGEIKRTIHQQWLTV